MQKTKPEPVLETPGLLLRATHGNILEGAQRERFWEGASTHARMQGAWWEGGGSSLGRGRRGKHPNVGGRGEQSDASDFAAARLMPSSPGHLAGKRRSKKHGLFRQREIKAG